LNGFLSEWVIYGSFFRALDHGSGAFAGLQALGLAALALMGGLALACFAKVFGVVFLGEPRDASVPMHPTPRGMKNAMFVLGLSCLLIGVLPGLWIPLVRSATGQLAGVLPAEFASHMASVLAPAVRLSSIAVLLAVIGVGLVGLRRWSLGRAAQRAFPAVPVVATWGCGFARPSSRMQYTASSFASFLVTTFRTLLWPEKRMAAPSGTFPSAGHVETSVADLAEHDLFGPVFRGASRLFGMIRTVSWRGEQEPPRSIGHAPAPRGGPVAACLRAIVTGLHRGSIQVRLSFVVLTLVTLFLFEAISSKGRPGMVEDAHVDSAQGVAR